MVGTTNPTTAPAAPSGLTATAVSSNQINLAWTNNANNQDGFYIYRSSDGTNFTLVSSAAAGATAYSVLGLSASTTYYFKIAAYNPVGTSAQTSAASATTSAPSGGQAERTGGIIVDPVFIPGFGETLAWSPQLGAPVNIGVYVYNPDGSLTTDQHARIDAAIATLNSATWNGTTGLNIYEVFDPSLASIVVDNATSTLVGGQADGLLGDEEATFISDPNYQTDEGNPYLIFNGLAIVNIVEGWNWYSGQDAKQIPSGAYDYQTVVLHELGHAVGLYEDVGSYTTLNGDGRSAMYPNLNTGQTRRDVSPYDIARLKHMYAYGADPGNNQSPGTADGLYVNGREPEWEARFEASMETEGVARALPGNHVPSSAGAVENLVVAPDLGASSQSIRSQGQMGIAFVTGFSSAGPAGAVQASVTPASAFGGQIAVVVSIPSLAAPSSFVLSQNAQIQSGGDAAATSASGQDLPLAPPAAEQDDAGEGATAQAPITSGQEVISSGAAAWREASSAFFLLVANDTKTTNGNAPDSSYLAYEGTGTSSALAAVALWGVLGSERRTRSDESRTDRRWLKKA